MEYVKNFIDQHKDMSTKRKVESDLRKRQQQWEKGIEGHSTLELDKLLHHFFTVRNLT